MTIEELAWHRRLEARAIAGITLLVALSLAAILAATARTVTTRSLARTTVDLEAARTAFHHLVTERAEFASAQSALVTALPVFRAHLSDARLAQDVATLEAMADHYRQQLKATFAIVGDRHGTWIAQSGWANGAPASEEIRAAMAGATAGRATRSVASADGRLFLVVSQPAGFADELLGTLTGGYALDDDLAVRLAQVTHCEINLVLGGRLYASSLPPADRDALTTAVANERWPAPSEMGSIRRFGNGEYAIGAFPLTLDNANTSAAGLILLDDWGPTQAFLNTLRWRLLGTGAVIFVIALAAGVLFSRRMARPLEDLAAAAQDIAGGNWTRQLPVRGSAEERAMAQAVNTMTTSLRHWYEEAKVRDDQLRHAQKLDALGRLAGGVAHDFNNVLTAIKGYGELLLDSFDGGDSRRGKAEGVLKAADTATSLTRQLLAFSRQRMAAVRVVSLGRLLSDVEKMLKRLIGEEIDLGTTVNAEVCCVRADPHQIEQVLLNLVVNARDAMPHGGSIDVALAAVTLAGSADEDVVLPPGPYVRLSVRDSGCGMTADVKARIFEPFFTTKQEGAGTGLGLAVVQGIVQQLGGAISVETEISRGSTFHIYLPQTSEAEEVATAGPTTPSAGTETVLLVEDEPDVAELLVSALQANGYTVLRAARGAEALEIVRTHGSTIHLLLTDVVMPGMNGRELADRATALRPDVQILYMSGYSDDALLRRGVEASRAHFIPKPFSIKLLTSKIREVLGAATPAPGIPVAPIP